MGSSVGITGSIGNGTCPNHPPSPPISYTTVLVTGAPTVLTNGTPTGILSCIGVSSCGHSTIALVGSATVISNGQPTHRVGDIGINFGQYVLTTGSPNVFAGG